MREKAAFGSGFRSQRGRVDASVLDLVKTAPGVAKADGQVQGFAQIIDSHNKALGNPGRGAPTLGFAWIPDRDLSTFHISKGRGPQAPNEIVIDATSADKAGYKVGAQVPVVTKAGRSIYHLVGIDLVEHVDDPRVGHVRRLGDLQREARGERCLEAHARVEH